MSQKICIVDTKAANFNSVVQAFCRLHQEVTVTSDLHELKDADKLVLPGVGTATAVMQGILYCENLHKNSEQAHSLTSLEQENKSSSELKDFLVNTTKPLLGICLGMQVQATSSTEVPLNSSQKDIATLGIIEGQVHLLDSHGQALPHMGWNSIRHNDHPLFKDIAQGSYFYFVHSYALDVNPHTIATCEYGQNFSAAIAHKNFMGVQFHPEKSGAVGERLLQNFIEL